MPAPRAVLIGLPGSGKTTVGLRLAQRLGVSFRDTDQDVEQRHGTPVAQILRLEGEARFRMYERAAVRRALAEHNGVLALGGGAVLDDRTQRDLAGHRVVHLSVDHATVVRRVGSARARPLLADDPDGELRALRRTRLPMYRRLATVTVPAPDQDADTTVDAVVAALHAAAHPAAQDR